MYDIETTVALESRIKALNSWIRTKCPASWIRPTVDEILALSVVPNQKSPLELLPTELLLEILSYLPLGSQACVTISSRTLLKKVGRKSWILLRTKRLNQDEIYLDFLQLLQRDMFAFYLCRRCLKLHSLDGDTHTKPWLEKDKGKELHMNVGGILNLKLGFEDVQLALFRHRHHGLEDGKTGAFCYSGWRPIYSASGFTSWLFDMEARVVSDHLLLRTQMLLEMDLSSTVAINRCETEFKYCLCGHLGWRSDCTGWNRAARRLADCFNDHDIAVAGQECEMCGFRPLCPCCPTETSLQKIPLKQDGCLAVITQWCDLGFGREPADPTWRAHIAISSPLDTLYPREFASWGWRDPKWRLIGIRERFEQQQGLTVEELTAIQIRKMNSGKWPSPRVRTGMATVMILVQLGYCWLYFTGDESVALSLLVCFLQILHCLFQLCTCNILNHLHHLLVQINNR